MGGGGGVGGTLGRVPDISAKTASIITLLN